MIITEEKSDLTSYVSTITSHYTPHTFLHDAGKLAYVKELKVKCWCVINFVFKKHLDFAFL